MSFADRQADDLAGRTAGELARGTAGDRTVIERILPPPIAAVERFSDAADGVLLPQEEAFIAGAADRRRREFATGRACARAALAQLGHPSAVILPGPSGAPQWPAGIVGSITHCAGYRACAVARARDFRAIGVDAEPNAALPDGLLDRVATPAEPARLAALTATAAHVSWDRMLFSAKEAVYKAWFPVTERSHGFHDVEITFEPTAGTFSVRLISSDQVDPLGVAALEGRWLTANGLLLAAVTCLWSPRAHC